jgi:hypothetical protein
VSARDYHESKLLAPPNFDLSSSLSAGSDGEVERASARGEVLDVESAMHDPIEQLINIDLAYIGSAAVNVIGLEVHIGEKWTIAVCDNVGVRDALAHWLCRELDARDERKAEAESGLVTIGYVLSEQAQRDEVSRAVAAAIAEASRVDVLDLDPDACALLVTRR